MQQPGGPTYQAAASYYGNQQQTWDTNAWAAYYAAWQSPQTAQAQPATAATTPTSAAANPGQPQGYQAQHAAAWAAYYQQYGMTGYGSPVQAGPAAASSAPAAASTAKAAVEMYDPTQPTTTSYVQPSAPAYLSAGSAQPQPKVSFQLRPSNPSYAKVVAQGKFQPKTPVTSTPQAMQSAGGNGTASTASGWPPNLRAYVERAFASCTSDQERNEMETVLKRVISETMQDGSMWTKNWDTEALPRLGAEQQQKRPAEAPSPNAAEKSRKKMKPEPKKSKQLQLMSLEGGNDRRALRSARFAEVGTQAPRRRRSNSSQPSVALDMDDQDWERMVVRGTCTTLEKEYLRLTSAPDPSTVRPEPILKKWLKALLDKYSQKPDYIYTCNQLKAIRQDLTVQHIKNGFTIKVYEKHARLALQNGDVYEFNACQSRLIELYDEVEDQGNVEEFTGYRILHSLYSNSMADAAFLMAELTPREREARPIAHALGVRAALAMSDYHNFFKLYKQTPNMGAYIIDLFIEKMRITALKTICKAYRPTIDVNWLLSELAFGNRKKTGLLFLRENGVVFDAKAKTEVDTRAFYAALIAKHPDRPES